MRVPKGIPQALLSLPARVVPGLVLVAVLEYASGGTLWARLLMHISVELLHPDNVWGFAVVVGLVVAISLGQLLAVIGNFIEQLTDRLLKRERLSDAYDWLRVHEPQAGELAAEDLAEFKLFNSLAASFLVSFIVSLAASFPPFLHAFFALSSVLMAWRGAVAKTKFQETAEKLRQAAFTSRPTAHVDARDPSNAK